MATGTAGDQARFQSRQVVNTARKQINWNDANNGVNVPWVIVPMGAFLFKMLIEIVTAFDGTATLVVGSNANANNIAAAGDVNELVAGVYEATRGYGRSLTAAANTTINTRLTSAAGSVGQAELLLLYEGNTG